MKQVDLLVPRFPPAHWNFSFAMDVEGSGYSHPPLGVATLAAYTPEGISTRIFDENVEEVELSALSEVVGISAMYIQRRRAFELADQLRALGKHVVLGGGLVSALPAECRSHADTIFHGEAELTWPIFLADFQKKQPRAEYTAPSRFKLDESRLPRFDLLKLNRYSTASIQTSRGCPFSCDYCDVPLFDGPRARTKPIELVMTEVQRHFDAGMRSIFIVDDNFIGNRAYAMKLLAELERFHQRTDYKALFYCQSSLNVATDDELLDALYRANFRRLFIGIETDDAAALKAASKPQNVLLGIEEAVRRIQQKNIIVWAALLLGFDDDDPSTAARYLAFADRANIGMVIPGTLQAVPGTSYHRRMTDEGRLRPLQNGYVAGQAGSLDSLLASNVQPLKMSYEQLFEGYRWLSARLYEPERYLRRLIGALEHGAQPELGRVGPSDLWAARGVLARTFRYYLSAAPADERRMFLGAMKYLAGRKFRRVDEAIFHLVIYKHLREFYRQASAAEVPLAPDLAPLEAAAVG